MIAPEEPKPRSVSRFGMALLILVTIGLGTMGGGVLGGIAGYVIALNQSAPVLSVPQPTVVSAPTRDLSIISQPNPQIESGDRIVVPENEALIAAVEAVRPATVTVLNFAGRSGSGSGSGVIIDKAGYIMTNHHVIEGARRVELILAHGGRVSAQLVGSSPEFDLAILKIDASQVPAIAGFGDSAALKQGERVVAIGSALGSFQNTVTSGVLSGHNRSLGFQHGLLQTDAAINHGNSGGPLINLEGEIVGINVMVLRGNIGGDLAEGLGFSIPSNTAKVVAKQLIETGEVRTPFLGVSYEPLNPQLSVANELSVSTGALIQEVISNTAAANSGLRSGDVILAVNGQLLDDAHPLRQLLLEHTAGDDIDLTIVRGTDQFDLTVTLGTRE